MTKKAMLIKYLLSLFSFDTELSSYHNTPQAVLLTFYLLPILLMI